MSEKNAALAQAANVLEQEAALRASAEGPEMKSLKKTIQKLQAELETERNANKQLELKVEGLEECVQSLEEQVLEGEKVNRLLRSVLRFQDLESDRIKTDLEKISAEISDKKDKNRTAFGFAMLETEIASSSAGLLETASMMVEAELLELEKQSSLASKMTDRMNDVLTEICVIGTERGETRSFANAGTQTGPANEPPVGTTVPVRGKRVVARGWDEGFLVPPAIQSLITKIATFPERHFLAQQKVMESILAIYASKLASDETSRLLGFEPLSLPLASMHHFLAIHGSKSAADFHIVELIRSVEAICAAKEATRCVQMFRRVYGLASPITPQAASFMMRALRHFMTGKSLSIRIGVSPILQPLPTLPQASPTLSSTPGTASGTPTLVSGTPRSRRFVSSRARVAGDGKDGQSSPAAPAAAGSTTRAPSRYSLCLLAARRRVEELVRTVFGDESVGARVFETCSRRSVFVSDNNDRVDLDAVLEVVMEEWERQHDLYCERIFGLFPADDKSPDGVKTVVDLREFSGIIKQMDSAKPQGSITRLFCNALIAGDSDGMDLESVVSVVTMHGLAFEKK